MTLLLGIKPESFEQSFMFNMFMFDMFMFDMFMFDMFMFDMYPKSKKLSRLTCVYCYNIMDSVLYCGMARIHLLYN